MSTQRNAKEEKMSVYEAIVNVQKDLASSGVGKNQTNTFDKYKFRGIDDVYNALAPLLARHKLCILPKVTNREVIERVSQKGQALFYVTVTVEYYFVSAIDGSSHAVISVGEAMDRGDKATNKAMSAAYKYACFQAFCIPTEGDNDADAQTHEVQPRFVCELINIMSQGNDIDTVNYWRSLDQQKQQWEWQALDKESQKHLKQLMKDHPAKIEG